VTLVNLNEILHEVINLSVDELLAAGVVVEWKPVPVLPAVYGNKKQLRGLFKYLLDNAITALKEGRTTNREVRILTHNGEGSLIVEMQDTGVGRPETLRLRVFEPLFSAWRGKRGHAGMGLAMAQEIANQHGGGIEIEAMDTGCRVRVVLPAAASGHLQSSSSTF
jgi:signal transduction histidine kinase